MAEEKTQKFPVISKELMDELERRYPEKCPHPDHTDRQIWMEVGQRTVVRMLRTQYKLQNPQVTG